MRDQEKRYYVESDGRIYLVERDGTLDLPRPDELAFDVDLIALLPSDQTWFCVPHLDGHPHDWYHKDRLAALPVTALVRDAVHATMPRVVVEALCRRDGKLLLVKGSRGLTEGLWTLPGGFLRFGETPEECILREIREEVGLTGTVRELAAVRSKLGLQTRLHWTMLFYRVDVAGEPVPDPDEIADVRFVDVHEATDLLMDETMARVIADLL